MSLDWKCPLPGRDWVGRPDSICIYSITGVTWPTANGRSLGESRQEKGSSTVIDPAARRCVHTVIPLVPQLAIEFGKAAGDLSRGVTILNSLVAHSGIVCHDFYC
jgi:hypothetical protein